MNQRFSLKDAAADTVATARSDLTVFTQEPDPAPAEPKRRAPKKEAAKSSRPATRENARGVTAWVEPEMYRMLRLVCAEGDHTMQDVFVDALSDYLAKKGKGRLTARRT